MSDPRHMDQGESKPRKIDESLKYGKRKKTDEDRFDCQRYAANPKKGFWKSLRKKKEM